MKKFLLIPFLFVCFIFTLKPAFAATVHITTCDQLQSIADSSTDSYILDNNINCSSIANFAPITSFIGTFDGQNNTIDNLTINRPDDSSIGLFSNTDLGATIANLNITNASITGFYSTGCLVGFNTQLTVSDSFTTIQTELGDYLGLSGNTLNISTNNFDATTLGANYFKNNSTVDPLNTWDFTDIWKTTTNYPIFVWQTDSTPTSTPTPTSAPSSAPQASNSHSPSGWSAPSCTDSAPVLVSDLFQINTTSTSAKLFFTPIDTNQFYVSFSTNPNSEMYGEQVSLLREGVQSHTIYYLNPNTTYYIKVRGQNGCMPGNWSNTMKFKTNSQTYYKNYSPISNLISNLTTKSSTKFASVSPTTTPTTNPVVSQAPKATEAPKTPQETKPTNSQPQKHCLLWWCW